MGSCIIFYFMAFLLMLFFYGLVDKLVDWLWIIPWYFFPFFFPVDAEFPDNTYGL